MHFFMYTVLQCTIHSIVNVHLCFLFLLCATISFVQQEQRAEKKVSYYVLIFKAPTAIFYQIYNTRRYPSVLIDLMKHVLRVC